GPSSPTSCPLWVEFSCLCNNPRNNAPYPPPSEPSRELADEGTRATSLECPIQADQVDQAREHRWHWVEGLASLRSLGRGVASAYAWSLPFSPCAVFWQGE